MLRPAIPRPRLILALACLVGACAGQTPRPAGAEPAGPPSGPAAAPPVAPLAAIGAANAERVAKRWEAAAGGWGRAVAVSAGLQRVAYSNGPEVLLYELGQGKRLRAVAGTCTEVVRGGLAYAGGALVIVCETAVQVVEAGGKVRELPVASAPITAAAFTETLVALGHHDGVLRVYGLDGSSPREIAVPGPPIDVKSLALTPDGKRLAVAWVQGSIWWWDIDAPTVPHDLVRHPSESDTLAFSGDSRFLAEEGESLTTTVWSFGDPVTPVARVRNGSWLKRIHFTRDGKWLVRGGSDGLELAELEGPRRVALDTRGAVEDVALDERGATIAAVDRDGRLTVWAAP